MEVISASIMYYKIELHVSVIKVCRKMLLEYEDGFLKETAVNYPQPVLALLVRKASRA